MSARHEIRQSAAIALALLSLPLAGASAQAAGINTDVALPVREGGFVFRAQLRTLDAGDDPTDLDRDVRVWAVPAVLVYGANARTTLFGIVPFLSQEVESNLSGRRVSVRREGSGDLTFLVRRTVHARDAVQMTSRLGLLGGVEVASGSDAFSSHSTDFLLGGVYTLQSGRHEFDGDLVWKINGEGRGVDAGDEYRADVAYQLRLAPWEWPERGTPAQVYGVMEANLTSVERTFDGEAELADSGGTIVFLSPGLQLVTRKVIYEASVQVPVVRNLYGGQVEPDLGLSAGVRINF